MSQTAEIKKAKHTPGPWIYRRINDTTCDKLADKFGISDSGRYFDFEISTKAVFQHTPKLEGPFYIGKIYRQEANAEFIVRACNSHEELLEALRSLLDSVPFAKNEQDAKIHQQAEAAIQKAEGGA